jgi:LPS-assembly protein
VDVAPGATNVPLPREFVSDCLTCVWKKKYFKAWSGFLLGLLINLTAMCFWLGTGSVAAASPNPSPSPSESPLPVLEAQPLHTSADKSFWDRKHDRVDLSGHAIVRQEGETLSADFMTLDFNTRTLDAKGNCVYITADSIIYGDEMHLNLDTRTGVVVGARVSNDRFTLAGERLNKLSQSRFQVHWGEYSTCKDCPNSWSLEAEDVDLTFGGYAYMDNVTAKIKDAPTFWLPYLVVPIKTLRQTGFLFPTYHYAPNTDGFAFVEPFFWAINRSTDMTIGLGDYTSRGTRVEWEGRYALSPRSGGVVDFDYMQDRSFAASPVFAGEPAFTKSNRWALNTIQTQELPFHIDEKLKLQEVSDNHYPIDLSNDVFIGNNMVLTDSLSFNYDGKDFSAYLAAERFRNILNDDPNFNYAEGLVNFDPTTVQAYPTAFATTNDRFLFGTPIAAGLNVGASNFTRTAGLTDTDWLYQLNCYNNTPVPTTPGAPTQAQICNTRPGPPVFGVDPIREATRLSIAPSIYTTLRPFDVIDVVPSATYYGYFYSFHNAQVENLERGYLLLQLSLSTQLERIWDTPDPDRPRQKHLIRPLLTYSNIPSIRESDPNHPFLSQIQYAQTNGISGYNFDDNDIVPVDNSPSQVNYFTPLGNSLAYGFTTQLITRQGALDKPYPSYIQNLEFTLAQSFNFRQLQYSPENRQPLSRLVSALNLNLDHFSSSSTYYYTPYIATPRNFFTSTETYIFERGVHQRVLTFDRSLSLTYTYDKTAVVNPFLAGVQGTHQVYLTANYSLNDYILPSAYMTYDFIVHGFDGAGASLMFQSPAQCYKIGPSVAYTIQNNDVNISFDFELNLAGSGFGAMSPTASGPSTAPGAAPGMLPY